MNKTQSVTQKIGMEKNPPQKVVALQTLSVMLTMPPVLDLRTYL